MFAQWNVRVVVVEPGGLRTEWKDSIEQLPVHPKCDRPKSPIVESRSRRMTQQAFIGNTAKAAKALMKIADMLDPPLRIQLGTECLLAVRNKAKRTVRDGENREELAHPTLTRAWCSRCSRRLTTERRVQACQCKPVYAVSGALYDSGGVQQV